MEALIALAMGRDIVLPLSFALDSYACQHLVRTIAAAQHAMAPSEDFWDGQALPLRLHLYGVDSLAGAVSNVFNRVAAQGTDTFVTSLYPDLAGKNAAKTIGARARKIAKGKSSPSNPLEGNVPGYRQIGYVPQDIFVEGNQIRLMRCISDTEIGEQRRTLLEDFRERTRAAIVAEQGDELREQIREELEQENGEPPTDEQVEEELEERLDDLVAIAEETFRDEDLPLLLDEAVRPLLRFDLDAPEFAALEDEEILMILGYQRIRRPAAGGFSVYYRDLPDDDRSDNLLSLPRYAPAEG